MINTFVFDARNGNLLGPFEKGDAEKMAEQLNHFVMRNTMPALASMGAKPTGPFYVRQETK